jgi:SAM-dependent methyltransferase
MGGHVAAGIQSAERDAGVTAGVPRVSPAWLALREAADAAARAPQLVARVRRHLAGSPRLVIHDLGSGTGSMARWLAPRLPGPQHWVTYDRDADLLQRARAGVTGAGVTVETRIRDITRLPAGDLDGASLVTASALLDMLTAAELERVVAACTGAGCPALFTISVIGRVELTPPDPLDATIVEAFNAHQRRTTGGRRLLGPDAVAACVDAFRRRNAGVLVRSSPWRLGADQADLASEWLRGWLAAACEQRPELARPVAAYASRRLAQAAAGRLGVVVAHEDVLAGCS